MGTITVVMLETRLGPAWGWSSNLTVRLTSSAVRDVSCWDSKDQMISAWTYNINKLIAYLSLLGVVILGNRWLIRWQTQVWTGQWEIGKRFVDSATLHIRYIIPVKYFRVLGCERVGPCKDGMIIPSIKLVILILFFRPFIQSFDQNLFIFPEKLLVFDLRTFSNIFKLTINWMQENCLSLQDEKYLQWNFGDLQLLPQGQLHREWLGVRPISLQVILVFAALIPGKLMSGQTRLSAASTEKIKTEKVLQVYNGSYQR